MTHLDFLEKLKHRIERGIPGIKAHERLLPSRILKERKVKFEQQKEDRSYRDSAVAIILYPCNNAIYCALIKRPTYDGKHSGQISFPGGKYDETDVNFEYTARREAFEEVGFPVTHGELVSQLTQLFIPVSNFLVHPYLIYATTRPEFVPDTREVEQIIEFDIFDLLSPELLQVKDMGIENGIRLKNIPYFNIQENVVWGATAMILSELKLILEEI